MFDSKKNNRFETTDINVEAELRNMIQSNRIARAKSQAIPHDKLYERIVSEAVILIRETWKFNAKHDITTTGDVTIKADNVFFLTPERKIHSKNLLFIKNPETGLSCFFDQFQFENDAEVEKFINDVLSKLPPSTRYETHLTSALWSDEEFTNYSFEVTIKMT